MTQTSACQNFIYFILAGSDRLKIGISKNVKQRLASLQTSCGEPLILLGTVPGTASDERFLHAFFSQERLRGEWFRYDECMAENVRRLLAEGLPERPQQERASRPDEARDLLLRATGQRIRDYLTSLFPTHTAARVSAATGIKIETLQTGFARGGCFSSPSMIAMLEAFGPAFLSACYSDDMRPPWLAPVVRADRLATIEREIGRLKQAQESMQCA